MYTKVLLISVLMSMTWAREDLGLKYAMRIYEDCQNTEGIVPCLKKKAILFFERAARMEAIPLINGINIVKNGEPEIAPISENDIESILPRNLADKNEALSDMLWERIARFANSRTIQLSLPKVSGEDLNKGVEEGRGKMKKMMSMMMMGASMKLATLIPIAIAGLFVLAGKALIVSKIALLLAGIIALKKLMAQKSGGGGGGGHESHGWSSGGGSGGWDRRAYNDASDLAYSSHKKV